LESALDYLLIEAIRPAPSPYNNRNTDVTEKLFARVDATEELPFLVTKLSLYYDR
jgi:hypothetical protein